MVPCVFGFFRYSTPIGANCSRKISVNSWRLADSQKKARLRINKFYYDYLEQTANQMVFTQIKG